MAIYDNGKAPVTVGASEDVAKVPRSAFNMSRVVNTNGIIGALMPIDILECVPNEDYTISYGVLAQTRNPLVRKLRNGMKIYLHSFFCPKRELWKGWDNYLTKGRSGNINMTVPKLHPAPNKRATDTSLDYAENDYNSFSVFAPSAYMGLPIAHFGEENQPTIEKFKPAKITADNKLVPNRGAGSTMPKWEVNALPFVMYNKIYRDYYLNQNLCINNKTWFPDDEDEWILPYNCEWANSMEGIASANETFNPEAIPNYVPNNNSTSVPAYLNMLHFRSFQGDYFTTANPFENMLRGNQEELNSLFKVNIDDNLFLESGPNTTSINLDSLNAAVRVVKGGGGTVGLAVSDDYRSNSVQNTNPINANITKKLREAVQSKINISGASLTTLRKAMVLEKYMLRMANTNGTYREMVYAMFGYKPNVYDRKPRYIGGTVIPINFEDIVQTSATDGSEYLGKTASKGTGAGNGYIGKYHTDDYGYIMTIMSIVPDTYYAQQGIETLWNRTTQDKEYFPISNNLEAQPILNKEIYISTSTATNENVFAWQERNADLKRRRNIITGLGACGNKAMYDSYNFMRREFAGTPSFNTYFLSMYPTNVDMKPFQSVNEPPFDLMIGCNIDKVSPMPYSSKPADMGIKY